MMLAAALLALPHTGALADTVRLAHTARGRGHRGRPGPDEHHRGGLGAGVADHRRRAPGGRDVDGGASRRPWVRAVDPVRGHVRGRRRGRPGRRAGTALRGVAGTSLEVATGDGPTEDQDERELVSPWRAAPCASHGTRRRRVTPARSWTRARTRRSTPFSSATSASTRSAAGSCRRRRTRRSRPAIAGSSRRSAGTTSSGWAVNSGSTRRTPTRRTRARRSCAGLRGAAPPERRATSPAGWQRSRRRTARGSR